MLDSFETTLLLIMFVRSDRKTMASAGFNSYLIAALTSGAAH